MNPTRLRLLALATAAVSVALALAAIAMYALTPDLDPLAGWGFVGYDALFALVYVAVGLLIATRRPGNLIAWLFLASAVFSGVQTLSSAYTGYGRIADPRGAAIALWIANWIWVPAVGLIVLTLLLYPNSRLPSPRWRWVAIGLIPVTLVPTILWAIATPDVAMSPDPFAVDPFALSPDHPLRGLAGPSLLLMTAWFIVAALSLRARMRRGTSVERQQVKWIAYAAAVVGLSLGASVMTSLAAPEHPLSKVTQVMQIGAVLLIPVAATVAILRYRLYDIDVLINRTLVYAGVSAILVGAYVLGVILFQSLLRPFTAGSELAIAASTLVVAALFQPVRARVQRTVDHRFYRARYDAARTLDEFSSRLREDVDLDSVRADLVEVLDRTVRPTHASVWLREP